MARVQEPEVLLPLRPRWNAGGRWLGDDNLDLLAHLLDDWFRIPGTAIRIGFDGVIGLIPGFGDVLAGLASLILIVAAWLRGVPYVTLARMAVNVGIEVLVGSVPFAGDVFVVAWKANRRNYRLMTRHIAEPHRHTWKDRLFLAGVVAGLWAVFVLPLVVIVLLVRWVVR
ncbi:MAG: DUF4112 domain-containing protein [Acidobacteria bacterium]|jgi:hypothetical protein|nr:DUF4112 domain-containing protein [Acidobacteriota bacterium]